MEGETMTRNRKISKLRAKAKKDLRIWSKAQRLAYLDRRWADECEMRGQAQSCANFIRGLNAAEKAMEETK